ncbi:MAG: outer membrane beta-barrel protein [Bacteroidetes bacterium]|nr:outer membrane beta-barrel protein [Bacteroidota bacterium]
MKRFLPILLLLASLLVPATAQAQLGVAAGLNFDELSDISGSRQATFDNSTGYHFGVFFDTDSRPLALRIGAYYRDMGDVDVRLGDLGDSFDLAMLDVAVDVRMTVLPTPVISPFISAGPVLSFPDSNNEEYKQSMESKTLSGNVGAGLTISLGGMTLVPELRYAVGISRLLKDDFTIRGVEISTDELQRQNSVMLRLGLIF